MLKRFNGSKLVNLVLFTLGNHKNLNSPSGFPQKVIFPLHIPVITSEWLSPPTNNSTVIIWIHAPAPSLCWAGSCSLRPGHSPHVFPHFVLVDFGPGQFVFSQSQRRPTGGQLDPRKSSPLNTHTHKQSRHLWNLSRFAYTFYYTRQLYLRIVKPWGILPIHLSIYLSLSYIDF